MQPRAFVVMPFGRKTPGHDFGHDRKAPRPGTTIDFDRIYMFLLKPALEKAGYEVARADSAANAGDIRTDMFFELVTADLVVADISILNPNVYYELGVRHGVCPRGVFLVSASMAGPAPFDIAPDRRFTYDASPFIAGSDRRGAKKHRRRGRKPGGDGDGTSRAEVDKLAKKFRDASTLDQQTAGSPVYAHLPGLKAVNWDHIETSKAKYFNALQSDWMDCVKVAQANGRPGDIVTLARNAPTRLHEARILFEAAIALINLCRYAAAEKVLEEVVRLNPDHAEAQLSLALVAAHLGSTTAAEHRLRKILKQHNADPRADELLGHVFRQLWRLSWQMELHRDVSQRRERAVEASQLAISAIRSFARAHRTDPKQYFAGFNALVLAFMLREVGIPSSEIEAGPSPQSPALELNAVKALVRYTATSEQQRALENGDYVEQFWCTTTLAGLLLMEGDGETAIKKVMEACAIPAATSYQLQTLRDRLSLLVDLGIQTEHVGEALKDVEQTLLDKIGHCSCERVVVWHGYGIDRSGRNQSRFPEDRAQDVADQIRRALRDWNVSKADLAICGGMTESDIIFAEVCQEMGARIRLMLRDPTEAERDQSAMWPPLASAEWRERLHRLRVRDDDEQKQIWIDTDHLGPVRSGEASPAEIAVRRHKDWLINTAKTEASPTSRPGETTRIRMTTLHGLFLWDGSRVSRDPNDSFDFIREVERFDGYQGEVKIIELKEASGPSEIRPDQKSLRARLAQPAMV